MHTLLGASVTTATVDLDDKLLNATGILFCEGYVWDSPTARAAFLEAAARVKSGAGASDFPCRIRSALNAISRTF